MFLRKCSKRFKKMPHCDVSSIRSRSDGGKLEEHSYSPRKRLEGIECSLQRFGSCGQMPLGQASMPPQCQRQMQLGCNSLKGSVLPVAAVRLV